MSISTIKGDRVGQLNPPEIFNSIYQLIDQFQP
jgi:hypothetical protein